MKHPCRIQHFAQRLDYSCSSHMAEVDLCGDMTDVTLFHSSIHFSTHSLEHHVVCQRNNIKIHFKNVMHVNIIKTRKKHLSRVP